MSVDILLVEILGCCLVALFLACGSTRLSATRLGIRYSGCHCSASPDTLSISQMYIDFSAVCWPPGTSFPRHFIQLALVFANQHAPNSLSIICQFRIPKPGDNGICFVSFNICDAGRQSWDLGWWPSEGCWPLL